MEARLAASVAKKMTKGPTSAQRDLMDTKRHKGGDWTYDARDRAVVSPGGRRFGKAGKQRG